MIKDVRVLMAIGVTLPASRLFKKEYYIDGEGKRRLGPIPIPGYDINNYKLHGFPIKHFVDEKAEGDKKFKIVVIGFKFQSDDGDQVFFRRMRPETMDNLKDKLQNKLEPHKLWNGNTFGIHLIREEELRNGF